MADNTRFASEVAAQRYEAQVVPTNITPHTHAVFDHVALYDGERVLDVACGTGIVARVAVERFPHLASIVGVDLNPAMLIIARTHLPATTIPVTWQEGDGCALPFPEDSFDVVVCQQGLQYIPDKAAALRHMHRVLVPGGRLICTVWSRPHRANVALADALRHHVSTEAAASSLAPFAWTDADLIRQTVVDAGFETVEMAVIESQSRMSASAESVHAYINSMAVRLPYAEEVAAVHLALEEAVSTALQPYRVGDAFLMPSQAHLVQARVA
jgi:ubiquinone/menaquinone biosynthesis C-methylase UbiE